jgi:ribosomal protein L11 methylase PrmA
VDIDARSVGAARKNAALNGLAERARFELPARAPAGSFDFVVANVEEPALLASKDAIVSRLPAQRSGAPILAVTGFLAERAGIVIAAFASDGLRALSTVTEGDFALIELG